VKLSQLVVTGVLLLISICLFLANSSLSPHIMNLLSFFLAQNTNLVAKIQDHDPDVEKAVLRQKLFEMHMQNLQLKEQLRSLTKFRQEISPKLVRKAIPAAILVYKDSSDNRRSFIINRGTSTGVKPGYVVVFGKNLLGRVFQVGDSSSTVLQITDPIMRIPAQLASVTQNNIQIYGDGVCEGSSRETCLLQFIERQTKLPDQGIAITSGLRGKYPKGLEIGEISLKNTVQVGEFWEIHIKPLELKNLQTVLVLAHENFKPE